MTPKQKERAVAKAIRRMDEAAKCLRELQQICVEHGVDMSIEEKFADGLSERASYWENCTWWKRK
ncbi:MAG: hypothetical protein P1V33_03350 [Pseudohongiella nitratireducens]|nr:hypothetical protein [Pseudohongiella nitratireducens]MDF1622490.1 hypothetical protein [Pseudohongiella nitratireducens]